MAFALSAEAEQKLNEIMARYPNKMAACIPVLHLCQEANDNWVSDDVIEFVAQRLELGSAHAVQSEEAPQASTLGVPHAVVRVARR